TPISRPEAKIAKGSGPQESWQLIAFTPSYFDTKFFLPRPREDQICDRQFSDSLSAVILKYRDIGGASAALPPSANNFPQLEDLIPGQLACLNLIVNIALLVLHRQLPRCDSDHRGSFQRFVVELAPFVCDDSGLDHTHVAADDRRHVHALSQPSARKHRCVSIGRG